MRVDFALLCVSFSVDRETNTLSIFNQFDSVSTPVLPIKMSEVCLIVNFKQEKEEEHGTEIAVKFITPSKKEINIVKTKVNFNDRRKSRTQIRLNGLEISEYGNNILRVGWGDSFHDVELNVTQMPVFRT